MQPAAVIFDFDGVIVDSMAMHIQAWDKAAKQLFGTSIPSDLMETLVGRSTNAIAAILAAHFGRPADALQLAEIKKAYLKTTGALPPALPGVDLALAKLRELKIPHGIASNAPREFIEMTTKGLGIKVDVIVGVEDARRPKPAPDVFLLCATRLPIAFTLHPKTLVFEDSLHGLKAAVSAGMIAIGVASHHSPDELRQAGARHTCLHLADACARGWFEHLPI